MNTLFAAMLAATLIDGIAPSPAATLPRCDVQYELVAGQRLVETCSLSRLHARNGVVQIQTNSELVDASLITVVGSACLAKSACEWQVVMSLTNQSAIYVKGTARVIGW